MRHRKAPKEHAPLSKVLVPHAEDCSAVEAVERGDWPNAWAFPTGRTHWRNIYGNETPKRRGYVMWVEIKCNCLACPALKIVRNDAVVAIGEVA